MKKLHVIGGIALSLIVVVSANVFAGDHSPGGHATHWGYKGDGGPGNWGKLSDEYSVCASGKSQSPINIPKSGILEVDTGGIKFDYNVSPLKVLNNGHTIQINCAPDSSIKIGAKTYKLLQFHFHSPSENMVGGSHHRMEAHLVHKNDDGQLAVVGVFIKEGKENNFIKTLWDNIHIEVGHENVVKDVSINPADLLPENGSYYHFSGSLTTPPCSENVNWNVLTTPIEASKNQISKFLLLVGENARPVQSVNNRSLIQINTGDIDFVK